jgi:phosphatidylserine decarboxylase
VNLSAIRDRLAASTVRWTPTRLYAGAVGWGARRTLPRAIRAPIYASFARVVGADLDEVEHPLGDYPSFGEFFARGLRCGARELDPDAQAVVAPCDGAVGASGAIERGRLYQAKGKQYELAELVASIELAQALEGGSFLTIYLSPRDYHRVHAPVAGTLAAWYHVPGTLFPVNEWFTSNVPRLFARNERVVTQLDTPCGPVVLVLVAAVGVGNIALRDGDAGALAPVPRNAAHTWRDAGGPSLARGDMLGAFHLGSTVVALFPPAGFELAAPPAGTPVRFGQKLGRVVTPARSSNAGLAGARRGAIERGT